MTKASDYPTRTDTEDFERMAASLAGEHYVPPKRTYSQRTDDRFAKLRQRERSLSFKHSVDDILDWHRFASRTPSTDAGKLKRAEDSIRFQHNSEGHQFSLPPLDELTPQDLADLMQVMLGGTPGVADIKATPHTGSSWKLGEIFSGKLSPASKRLPPVDQKLLKERLNPQSTVAVLGDHGPVYEKDLHHHGLSVDIVLKDSSLRAHLPRLCFLMEELDFNERFSVATRGHGIDWSQFTPKAVARQVETICDQIDAANAQNPRDNKQAIKLIHQLFSLVHLGHMAQFRDAVLYGKTDLKTMMEALENYRPSPRIQCSQTADCFHVGYGDQWIQLGGGRGGGYKILEMKEGTTMRLYFHDEATLDLFATAIMNLLHPPCRARKIPLGQSRDHISLVPSPEQLTHELNAAPRPAVRIKTTRTGPEYRVDEAGVIHTDFTRNR